MGARTVGSLVPSGEATDDITADEDALVETAKGSRRSGSIRTRPVVDARAAVGTAVSVADAMDGRRATGVRLP
jgi:hypothetical protein